MKIKIERYVQHTKNFWKWLTHFRASSPGRYRMIYWSSLFGRLLAGCALGTWCHEAWLRPSSSASNVWWSLSTSKYKENRIGTAQLFLTFGRSFSKMTWKTFWWSSIRQREEIAGLAWGSNAGKLVNIEYGREQKRFSFRTRTTSWELGLIWSHFVGCYRVRLVTCFVTEDKLALIDSFFMLPK